MSKAEKTKAFIIEKAAYTFNKKGFAGTSLNDLIEITGLTKGALYGHFANKEAIAIEAYLFNVKELEKKLSNDISKQTLAKDKLLAFIDFYRFNWKTIFEWGGCPMLNAAIEADDNLPFLKKYIATSIKIWVKIITRIIDSGKESKDFKSSVNTQDYAYTIATLVEGGIMMAKINNNKDLLVLALDRAVKIIEEEMVQ